MIPNDGKVDKIGMDVIKAISEAPVNERHRPISPVCIERITIHSNPIADRYQVLNYNNKI